MAANDVWGDSWLSSWGTSWATAQAAVEPEPEETPDTSSGGEVEKGRRLPPFTGRGVFPDEPDEIPGEAPLTPPQDGDKPEPVTPVPITDLEPEGHAQAQADRKRELAAKRKANREAKAKAADELKTLRFIEEQVRLEAAILEAARVQNLEDEGLLVMQMERKRRLVGQYIAIKERNEGLQTQGVISGLSQLLAMIQRIGQ